MIIKLIDPDDRKVMAIKECKKKTDKFCVPVLKHIASYRISTAR